MPSSSSSPSSVRERKFILPESSSKAQISDSGSNLAVIVTHPWGPLGGNMNNNVVLAIVVWFQRMKITTLRFDFYGSQLGRGDSQVAQVKEAANFLLHGQHQNNTRISTTKQKQRISSSSTTTTKEDNRRRHVPKFILLVGYSYGSIISASASNSIPQCIGTIMVSPPLAVRHWLYLFHGNYHLEQARKSGLPLLMMIGSKDNFTSEDSFMETVHTMPQNTTTGAVLKDADHFFHKREKDIMDIIGHWILSVFPQQCNGDLSLLADADFQVPTGTTLDSRKTSVEKESYTGCPCTSVD
ncbi:MAG: alpha/beta superfamily hydrolase [Bacillariaceae sp.]|jgi:alpha/beta superfamily hydrolase